MTAFRQSETRAHTAARDRYERVQVHPRSPDRELPNLEDEARDLTPAAPGPRCPPHLDSADKPQLPAAMVLLTFREGTPMKLAKHICAVPAALAALLVLAPAAVAGDGGKQENFLSAASYPD